MYYIVDILFFLCYVMLLNKRKNICNISKSIKFQKVKIKITKKV
jgi:hypothetical protein